MLLTMLAPKFLPLPRSLDKAVREGHIAMLFSVDGSAVYIVPPDCPNRPQVLAGIRLRKLWERWVGYLDGAAVAALALNLILVYFK